MRGRGNHHLARRLMSSHVVWSLSLRYDEQTCPLSAYGEEIGRFRFQFFEYSLKDFLNFPIADALVACINRKSELDQTRIAGL
jgi:hypothetical protein